MKASTGLKKMLSILMSAVLILLLDATAFAEEPGSSTEKADFVSCMLTKGCTLEADHEGECVVGPN